MIAVDTNIVVRLLTRDNEEQYMASHRLFARESIFVADSVVLECEWVLRHAYDFAPADIADAFRNLFGLPNVTLANAHRMARVLEWHATGLDFADAMHLALSEHSDELRTFDKSFAKRAKGLSSCMVSVASR